MLQRGEEVSVKIINSAFEGKSIARLDDLVIFVDGGVPGDVATVRITKSKKNFAEAKLVKVETFSPLRVDPRCTYFGVCGGCKWQQVDYAAQLRFKQQHVVDAFERIGRFTDLTVRPILGSDEKFFYRGKMEYSFAEQQWLWDGMPEVDAADSIFLGLHVPQRYDKVLDIRECLLQSDRSNKILNFTRTFAQQNGLIVYNSDADSGYLRFLVIREGKRTNEIMVNLVTFTDDPETMRNYTTALLAECPFVTTVVNTINTRKAQIAFGETEHTYHGTGVIHDTIGAYRFDISASSFFQTNVLQAEKLYTAVKEFGAFKPTDVVYDLYSGTGSIGIFLSGSVKSVVGVESVESAIQDAERNAKENGVTNCTFLLGDLKDRLTKDKDWMSGSPKPDVMVIDPPRNGMHPKVVEEIIALAPERIVYVSCNPATQARDAQLLCAERYTLEKLQPVDMFPHTFHIENVALFIRKSEEN
jgi:23S rRNA (uracil1939-C5)-methyltransferase